MFRRLVPMLMVAVLLSLMLAACGDDTTALPTYPGATSIDVPAATQSQFAGVGSGFKSSTFTAFSTSDDSATAKTNYSNAFNSGGWTVTNTSSADLTTLQSAGMFVLGYTHGNKGAVALIIPASLASTFGFTSVTTGSVVLVVSGNAS